MGKIGEDSRDSLNEQQQQQQQPPNRLPPPPSHLYPDPANGSSRGGSGVRRRLSSTTLPPAAVVANFETPESDSTSKFSSSAPTADDADVTEVHRLLLGRRRAPRFPDLEDVTPVTVNNLPQTKNKSFKMDMRSRAVAGLTAAAGSGSGSIVQLLLDQGGDTDSVVSLEMHPGLSYSSSSTALSSMATTSSSAPIPSAMSAVKKKKQQIPEKMGVVEDYKGISAVEDPFYATSDSNDEHLSDEEEYSKKPDPLRLERAAMDQRRFHERLQYEPRPRRTFKNVCVKAVRRAGNFRCWDFLLGIFPILHWLPRYDWKSDGFSELSAGITVAVMHIPQGMAYALLASVDPIVGIYTAFFPVIIYICMGTAKHVSVGTFAVISLLVAKPVHTYANLGDEQQQLLQAEQGHNYTAIQVVSAVTFMSGIFQIIFSILHLGALCSLLSHPLIRGFTTGAAFHVFTTQVKEVFGLAIPRFDGAFYIFKVYHFVFVNIYKTNLVTLGLSLSVILSLELYSHFLEKRLTKALRGINFPVHLVLVILGIVVSWAFDLKVSHKVKVVDHVDTGLPAPFFPPVELLSKVMVDALIIAIVTNVVIYSLGLLYATKYQYKVSADQEFLAQGMSNIFGSFFSSLPLAGSLSRTSVQEKAGGRTMVTSAVSAFLLLFVLLFAGPILYHLPNAVLAAIIIEALKGMFLQFSDLPPLLARSFSDFSIWIITFTATVVLDVQYGLMVGVAVNFVMLLYWALYPKVVLLAETDFKDLCVDPEFFHDVRESGKYIILRLLGNINFSNSARMQEEVESVLEGLSRERDAKTKPGYLILDLVGVPQMDLSGCVSLIAIHKNLRSKRLRLAIVGASGILWRKFELCGVFDEIHRHRCFPTLHDAFAILRQKEKVTVAAKVVAAKG